MNSRQAGTALLILLLACSFAALVWTLPNILFALPSVILAAALLLIARRNKIGFSVGLAGLFVMFVFAVAMVIGDAEEPTLSYVAVPRFAWLAIASVTFLALAWVLKRAQNHE
jgi:hypothetical protein